MEINHNIEGDWLKLSINGKIDNTTAEKLENTLKLFMNNVKNIEIDFSNVSYISSAGLRVILSLKKSIKGKLELVHLNDNVKEVFDVTGFSSIITIK